MIAGKNKAKAGKTTEATAAMQTLPIPRSTSPVAKILQRAFTPATPDDDERVEVKNKQQVAVPSLGLNRTILGHGTKRESPRSRPPSSANELKDQTNIVFRPRPIKQSPRTMTSLEHVEMWEEDSDVEEENSFTTGSSSIETVTSNSSTPTQLCDRFFHPLRIHDNVDESALHRSQSPVVCKRNRMEAGGKVMPAERSHQSAISPRDHRSRPRSRCGRRVDVSAASIVGPEMSIESPKVHESTSPLRLHQQHPNSVYSPVTDSKIFSEIRGVNRKDAATTTRDNAATSALEKVSLDNSDLPMPTQQLLQPQQPQQQQLQQQQRQQLGKPPKSKSAIVGPRRSQTLTQFDIRSSFNFSDVKHRVVPRLVGKKVHFNQLVTVTGEDQTTLEDLRSSNNSAQMIKNKYLPVINRRPSSASSFETDQSQFKTPITC